MKTETKLGWVIFVGSVTAMASFFLMVLIS